MSQKTLYPLLLSDNLHAKVWGGTRIKPMKGLAPDSERIGESWECSAVPGSESVVENGIFAGRTLNSLVEEYGEKLLGKKVFKMYGAKFPLLIKFIDAEHDLSIQVHPDNKMAKDTNIIKILDNIKLNLPSVVINTITPKKTPIKQVTTLDIFLLS